MIFYQILFYYKPKDKENIYNLRLLIVYSLVIFWNKFHKKLLFFKVERGILLMI